MKHSTTLAVTLAVLLLALGVAACSSKPPPPPPPIPPTTIKLSITASEQINPNSAKLPSPVVVRVYELRSLDQFNAADFFQLFDSDQQVLAQSLVARREVVVKPGDKVTVEGAPSGSADTRFIGMIAAYREVQSATWRASVPVYEHAANAPTAKLDVNALSMEPPAPPAPPPEPDKGSWWWPF